ncbi:MAG TPA: response regulator [Allosphingosinicella sp.]
MNNLPVLLLVDDEPLIRAALADVLTEAGYFPLEAEDGAEAMGFIEVCATLLGVITDIRLGSGAYGWEVARHARHRFPNIPVVYMTGDSAADWSAEGVPNSILLQKPFANAQLVTAISNLLNVTDVYPSQVGSTKD